MKIVVFQLKGKNYAVELQYIHSIEKISEIRELPQTPPYYKGIINMRGDIISIIDLAEYFNLGNTYDSVENFVLITRHDDLKIGLIVDIATDVLDVDSSLIRKAPSIINEKYINGILNLEDRIIVMLNLPAILKPKEIMAAEDLSASAI